MKLKTHSLADGRKVARVFDSVVKKVWHDVMIPRIKEIVTSLEDVDNGVDGW